MKRANVVPWPKLFQNLRSTRQTELSEHFPSHVVCAWLGNSEEVAKKHYLQVTQAHVEKALAGSLYSGTASIENSALHNPVQQPAALTCNVLQTDSKSSGFLTCLTETIPPRGVEPRFSD
jgi:hypothetical protein